MATRYFVRFDSADDGEIDGKTTLLEDEGQTLDTILETCERYRIRALVLRGGDLLATIIPGNERRVPFGEGKK
jgi:hypothetical protein